MRHCGLLIFPDLLSLYIRGLCLSSTRKSTRGSGRGTLLSQSLTFEWQPEASCEAKSLAKPDLYTGHRLPCFRDSRLFDSSGPLREFDRRSSRVQFCHSRISGRNCASSSRVLMLHLADWPTRILWLGSSSPLYRRL